MTIISGGNIETTTPNKVGKILLYLSYQQTLFYNKTQQILKPLTFMGTEFDCDADFYLNFDLFFNFSDFFHLFLLNHTSYFHNTYIIGSKGTYLGVAFVGKLLLNSLQDRKQPSFLDGIFCPASNWVSQCIAG